MTDRTVQFSAYSATAAVVAFGAWCVWARTPPGDALTRFDKSIGCNSPLGVLIGFAALLCGFGAVLAGLAAVLSWRLRRGDWRSLGVAVSLGVLALSGLGAAVAALWLASGAGQASFCD